MKSSIHTKSYLVEDSWLDVNQHMNNIEYVRVMQDIAVEHSDVVGCTSATHEMGAAWFVRAHSIEYKRPASAGEMLTVDTWISGTDRLRSTREYEFRNVAGVIVATAETVWILVDQHSGRPKRIPPELIQLFG